MVNTEASQILTLLFSLLQYSHVPLELCMQLSLCALLFKKFGGYISFPLPCNKLQNFSILKEQIFIIIFVD